MLSPSRKPRLASAYSTLFSKSTMREDEEALLPRPGTLSSPHQPSFSISLRAVARQTAAFLRPSFLKRQPMSPVELSEKTDLLPKKTHATEYLDGVRGVASLIVFILHWGHIPYPSMNAGWGYNGNTSIWLLPFVRLIFSGAAMVSVFFVVSGFVLSHRFIQRMSRHEYAEMFPSLSSITFRRAARLFLPAFASSTMAFVCVCLGIVPTPQRVNGRPFKHGLSTYLDYLDFESNPWNWELGFNGFYNPQLWSIAVEFRGSMVIFLMIVGLARTRPLVRLAVEGITVIHCFGHYRWDVALFIAGMMIAEIQVLTGRPTNRSVPAPVKVLLCFTMIVGVFLSGIPRDGNAESVGYMWTQHVWPYNGYRRRFWLAIGAIMIVGSMAFLPLVQALFLTRPARYLGRISFALYLVHGLGNRTIGKWLLNGSWDYIGKEGYWPYNISVIIATVAYFPIAIWLSDIFWRGVDLPSIELAKWLEAKCASREAAI